ncbi:hypothetical protein MRX96_030106 [Rhipicephalus microplus]
MSLAQWDTLENSRLDLSSQGLTLIDGDIAVRTTEWLGHDCKRQRHRRVRQRRRSSSTQGRAFHLEAMASQDCLLRLPLICLMTNSAMTEARLDCLAWWKKASGGPVTLSSSMSLFRRSYEPPAHGAQPVTLPVVFAVAATTTGLHLPTRHLLHLTLLSFSEHALTLSSSPLRAEQNRH